MNTSPPTPPPPDPLAVALAKLDPAPHGFDWNALMFAAGRASKGRALLFWRVAAGVGALVAVGFAVAYFTREPVYTERQHVIYVDRAVPVPPAPVPEVKPEPEPRPEPSAPQGWNYDPAPEPGAAARWLNMRNEVLSVGLSVLPDSGPKVSPPVRGEK